MISSANMIIMLTADDGPSFQNRARPWLFRVDDAEGDDEPDSDIHWQVDLPNCQSEFAHALPGHVNLKTIGMQQDLRPAQACLPQAAAREIHQATSIIAGGQQPEPTRKFMFEPSHKF